MEYLCDITTVTDSEQWSANVTPLLLLTQNNGVPMWHHSCYWLRTMECQYDITPVTESEQWSANVTSLLLLNQNKAFLKRLSHVIGELVPDDCF